MMEAIRRALGLLDPQLRLRWLLFIPWAALSAAIEMIATAGILILIRLIGNSGSIGAGPLAFLRSRIGITDNAKFNVTCATLLGVIYLVKNILRWAETRAQQRCSKDSVVWISSGLLERYLRAPYSLHLRRNSSEMLHIVSVSADQVVWHILQPAVALVSEALVAAAILAVLVLQLPAAAVGVAAGAVALMTFLLWTTQHRHTVRGAELHEMHIHQLQTLRQSLSSVKEAKILQREHYFVDRFARLRLRLAEGQAEAEYS